MAEHHQTVDLDWRRVADRKLAEKRIAARKAYVEQSELAAAADRRYRQEKGKTYTLKRSEGETGEGAKILAEAAASDHLYARNLAASLAKAALLAIEEAEREAVTVRDIHSASERVDGLVAS
jgi:hypothetical protein